MIVNTGPASKWKDYGLSGPHKPTFLVVKERGLRD